MSIISLKINKKEEEGTYAIADGSSAILACLETVDERDDNTGATASEGVAERDGTTIKSKSNPIQSQPSSPKPHKRPKPRLKPRRKPPTHPSGLTFAGSKPKIFSIARMTALNASLISKRAMSLISRPAFLMARGRETEGARGKSMGAMAASA